MIVLFKKRLIRFNIVDDAVLWCTWGCSSWTWTGIRGDVRNPLSDIVSNSIMGGANSFSPRYNSLWGFRSWGDRIRSSQNGIRDDVTQRISDVTSNSGSRPTTAPPSASQDRIVDYISNCIYCRYTLFLEFLRVIKFFFSIFSFINLYLLVY